MSKNNLRKKILTRWWWLVPTIIIVALLLWQEIKTRRDFNSSHTNTSSLAPVTTDYLTYTNSKYGYSFTYPAYVAVMENAGKFHNIPADAGADVISFLSTSTTFTQLLSIWPESDVSLQGGLINYVKAKERYKDGYLEEYSAPYIDLPREQVLKLEEVIIDNKQVVILISKILPGQGNSEETTFKAWIEYRPGKLLYMIDQGINYHPVDFDLQILRSFKFTTPVDPVVWPEYQFPKLGFAFRAPPDWLVYPQSTNDASVNIDDKGYISSPSFLLGPAETLKNLDPKSHSNSSEVGSIKNAIKGYIGYNSMLNVRSYIEWVDGRKDFDHDGVDFITIDPLVDNDTRRAFIARGSNHRITNEVYIELNDKFGLTLFIEDEATEKIFYRLLRSIRFTN